MKKTLREIIKDLREDIEMLQDSIDKVNEFNGVNIYKLEVFESFPIGTIISNIDCAIDELEKQDHEYVFSDEIRVLAETSGHAEHVATFADDKLYNACLPSIEAWAKSNGFTSITESVS